MTTLAHISDLHFGRLDVAAAEALVGELHALAPDLLIVSGDLTQRARRAQFAAARAYLQRLPRPQLVVPGNHDVPLYDLLRRWLNPHGRFARMVCDDPYPLWQNAQVQVVGINTACRMAPRLLGFWKDGKVRPEHLRALAGRLGPADGRLRVLVAHHPFVEPAGGHAHGIIHGAAAALPELERLQIDLILSGHLHMSYRGNPPTPVPGSRRILNLMAGSATSTRRRDPFNAYNVVRVVEGRDSDARDTGKNACATRNREDRNTGRNACATIEIEVREFRDGRWTTAEQNAPAEKETPGEP